MVRDIQNGDVSTTIAKGERLSGSLAIPYIQCVKRTAHASDSFTPLATVVETHPLF